MKDLINYEDFSKLELRVVKILSAERVEGSEKLLKLTVDSGETDLPAGRQVIAGIGKQYAPEDLTDKKIIIIANLEPRKLMGLESQGMLLAASTEERGPFLLVPDQDIDPGAEVR